ncbi:DUF333 domain-containing protein [Pseudomonas sp. F1_0610]|uniref:putative hemolysin n=1 Tax=Pseudomonas sp. F1_0610 TaxID=3114284 RepID=UPI0039C2F1B4
MKKLLALTLPISFIMLTACQSSADKEPETVVDMANPASLYCIKSGGESILKQDAEGNTIGWCRLADGTLIEEWELYHKNHPS